MKKQLAQAVRLFEGFRERKPRRVADVRVKIPAAAAVIGYVDQIGYRTTHGTKKVLYRHDFAKGSRPLFAVSADGKQLLLLGGRYHFTERGIVDLDTKGKERPDPKHDKDISRKRNPKFKPGMLVKFAEPQTASEKTQRFYVVEDRSPRLLVEALKPLSPGGLTPQFVYAVTDMTPA